MTDFASAALDAGKGALGGFMTGGPVGALLGALGGVLPDIASMLFGDRGATVQAAAQAAAAAVTGMPAPTAADIANLPPDKTAELRVQLAQIAATERQAQRAADQAERDAYLANVQGARDQTVNLAKAGSAIAWGAPAVSVVVLATFGTMLWIVLTHGLPAGSESLANILLGSLSTMASGVVGYWVGSNAGSQQKTAMLFASKPVMQGGSGDGRPFGQ